MTKKEYLKQLKKALRFRVGRSEKAAILADYDSFFAEDALLGKSEGETAAALGPPTDVAADLPRLASPWRYLAALVADRRYLIAAAIMMAVWVLFAVAASGGGHGIVFVRGGYFLPFIFRNPYIAPVFAATIVWLALCGVKTSDTKKSVKKGVFAAFHIASAAFAAICFAVMYFSIVSFKNGGAGILPLLGIPWQTQGPYMNGILVFFLWASFAIGAAAAVLCKITDTRYFSCVCHAIAAFIFILAERHVLFLLNDLYSAAGQILERLGVYAAGLAVTGFFDGLRIWRERGRR